MGNESLVIARIQKEQKDWAFKNFGQQTTGQMVLGMIEELGELADGLELKDAAKVEDAIGDFGIYLSNYCNIAGLWLSALWEYRTVPGGYPGFANRPAELGLAHSTLAVIQGYMAHHQLKAEQNIRGGTAFHNDQMKLLLRVTLDRLQTYAAFVVAKSFPEILKDTWVKVSKRDWVENPNDAHEVAEAQDV